MTTTTTSTSATTATATDPRSLLDEAAAVRFLDNIKIAGRDDCWPWVGASGTREPTGHVRVWHQGVKIYAHRLSFLLAGGQIEEGQVVMHTVCDNGACQNARHMRAGTTQENTAERDEKNRRTPFLPHGEAHWSSKITNVDAMRIRAAKQLGLNAHHLALLFGVSRSTVYSVLGGLHYPSTDPSVDDPVETTK